MKEIKQTFTCMEMAANELTSADKNLMEAALEAARHSYAPYSRFHVGAALLLDNGEIVCGGNQENAAYPSGLCAERTALFYAGSRYPEQTILTMALIAEAEGEIRPSISPCGACRQVLLESEMRNGHPIRILLCGRERVLEIPSAQSLLPLSFSDESLA
ncbi:MAG: cytidine deaminase [Parabacteroides sp.]